MSRITLAAAIAFSTVFAGCAACPKPAAVQLTGVEYARVCQHPSMTRAAYREAFACQRQAFAGTAADLARDRHDASHATEKPQTRSAWVAAAEVTGLD